MAERGFWGRWPLRVRLAAVTAAAVAAAVVAGTAVAFVIVRHQLTESLDLSLKREAVRVERQLGDAEWLGSGECVYLTAPSCVQLIGPDGTVDPPQADDTPWVPQRAFAVARGEAGPFFTESGIGDIPVRGYVAPLGDGRAVQVSVRADGVRESVRETGVRLAAAGAAGVALAAALGYAVARTGLRPVERLTRTAETIAATRDPRHRIDLEGGDELARLAGSFNQMLAELEASAAAQRRLVADASHELRTPLTGLRTNIDLLARDLPPDRRDQVVRTLRAQSVEMTGLVNDLIELARGEREDRAPEPVRLDEVVRHCVRAQRRDRPRARFGTDLEPVLVEAVPDRITRAVGNLLDNAAKFAPEGRPVEVRLGRTGTGGAELTVRDHGPGIPEEDLPYVFDRFYRAPSARSLPGSGLGLAIVAQVAEASGAKATAERPEGGGTLMRLTFPKATPAEAPSP
ncbi:HAMP domain-containing sensor histidine kinase [Nocardiopsis sp. RSe5-2]|uniref:histidine kinase n=1 Tax=Nocardiopsis endophytica TaxID=3018445 RepID=A0ABT4UB90_9ACTN|nr:HAMP domain-containing sensor histidine kinase [Nocardiopsis endophytica]MDA2814231.1 HAMP domain-containing sensor histidine kinase [Nocardiopsis endophytica]